MTAMDEPETFKGWMKRVDQELLSQFGVTHTDIADQTWRDWYRDNLSPADAIDMIDGHPLFD